MDDELCPDCMIGDFSLESLTTILVTGMVNWENLSEPARLLVSAACEKLTP